MFLIIDDQDVFAATSNREIDPQKPSVVFIHGAGQDHTIWVLPKRYFTRHGYNVVAIDLPGHGRSSGPPLPCIEDMADWVIRVVEALGIEQVAVVGHSMGTLVAIETATRHPGRVRAIALVGTAVPMPVSDALLESSRDNDHVALDMLNLWGHSNAAHIGGNETPGVWMLGTGLRLLERADPGIVYADLNACNAYTEGLEHAKQIECQAMLILGEKDAMTPTRAAKKLQEALPQAKTVVLKGSGHALLAERPNQVLDVLIKIV